MNFFPWLTLIVAFPISAGSLIFFLPQKGNKIIRWYTICICILELLIMTYAFRYHFRFDDPLIQLAEEYKWIRFFFFFLLEIRNRWTFYRTHFINRIYYYFSYFSGLASYSRFTIFPFLDVSNV